MEDLQNQDSDHAFGGDHAAALQLPVLVLVQQYRPHQAGDRGVVEEDADDPCAPPRGLTQDRQASLASRQNTGLGSMATIRQPSSANDTVAVPGPQPTSNNVDAGVKPDRATTASTSCCR